HREGKRPRDASRSQARHLRRAWRRSGFDPILPSDGTRLRLVLALPRACCTPRGGASKVDIQQRCIMSVHGLCRKTLDFPRQMTRCHEYEIFDLTIRSFVGTSRLYIEAGTIRNRFFELNRNPKESREPKS